MGEIVPMPPVWVRPLAEHAMTELKRPLANWLAARENAAHADLDQPAPNGSRRFLLGETRMRVWSEPQGDAYRLPLSLNPLNPADLLRADGWLQRPHVQRWWDTDGDGWSDIVEAMETPCIAPYSIRLGDESIGYLQLSHANSDTIWDRMGVPAETLDLELFIAEEVALNRGLGRRAIALAITAAFADPRVNRLQAAPHPRNHTAIATFKAAGLAAIRPIITPLGGALYMALDRD